MVTFAKNCKEVSRCLSYTVSDRLMNCLIPKASPLQCYHRHLWWKQTTLHWSSWHRPKRRIDCTVLTVQPFAPRDSKYANQWLCSECLCLALATKHNQVTPFLANGRWLCHPSQWQLYICHKCSSVPSHKHTFLRMMLPICHRKSGIHTRIASFCTLRLCFS